MTDSHPTEDERIAGAAKALGDISAYPWDEVGYPGISLRQLLAAMAMQGMLAGDDGGSSAEYVAQDAVKHADALLKELARG